MDNRSVSTAAENSGPDDSMFRERSPPSSNSSIMLPRGDEIDRWQRHIRLENFATDLQRAAMSLYSNETRSRYSNVYVLMIKWETEDPKLPVSYEIEELRKVFSEIYQYDVEIYEIPDKRSHARVSEKINAFIDINDDSKDDLKIVYYAGHSRLSKTRDLVWSSLQNNRHEKAPSVTWTGIQHALEQALSDVLILLDCCSSGIGDVGEGNGVTELMSACAFDVVANGVGHYSFTKALTTELRLLSKKRLFPIHELYTHVYCRAQHHMAQGLKDERYPAPIHLLLTRDERFPRSIQLAIQGCPPALFGNGDPGVSELALLSASCGEPNLALSGTDSSQELENESSPASRQECKEEATYLTRPNLSAPCEDISTPNDLDLPSLPIPPAITNEDKVASTSPLPMLSSHALTLLKSSSKESLWPTNTPRLLFAIRLEDSIDPEDLSVEYFADWLRGIPIIAKEIQVEAGFTCDSTLLIVALPLPLWAYLSQDPAITPLGPIKSSNLLARRCDSLTPLHSQMSASHERMSKRAAGKRKEVSFQEGPPAMMNAESSDDSDSSKEVFYDAVDPDELDMENTNREGDCAKPFENFNEIPHSPPAFEVSGPALIYVRNIHDKFPLGEIKLIERLGEANWQRHVRIRSRKEGRETVDFNPQQAAQSVFQPVSLFHDSGLGSSLPEQSSYAASLSSLVSRADDKDRDHFRVPPTPKEVSEGLPFECLVCQKVVTNIRNRVQWKSHIFADIQPYICTFAECPVALLTFPTRDKWAAHQIQHYTLDSLWICSKCRSAFDNDKVFQRHVIEDHSLYAEARRDTLNGTLQEMPCSLKCPLCQVVTGGSKKAYMSHVAKHMESIALAALPRDSEEDSSENGSDEGIRDPRRETVINVGANEFEERSANSEAAERRARENAESILFDLKIVSPSTGVSGPLAFKVSARTNIKILKAMIREALPSKPDDQSQRLIYRGRLLSRDTETMLDIFGEARLRENTDENYTIHLVLRPRVPPKPVPSSLNPLIPAPLDPRPETFSIRPERRTQSENHMLYPITPDSPTLDIPAPDATMLDLFSSDSEGSD